MTLEYGYSNYGYKEIKVIGSAHTTSKINNHILYAIFNGNKNLTDEVSMGTEPNQPQNNHNAKEVATLAGGCFWCLEAIFKDLIGIEKVESGYSGGTVANPSYRQVCNGTTGHAEAVNLTFNPQVITFKEISEIFFFIHDPTTLNRQGADVGTQYRSAIFYHSLEQKRIADQVIQEITSSNIWDSPIITEVAKFSTFYIAEDYHQDYFENNSDQPYCHAVIAPKVAKFRTRYLSKLKR
jgi:peptide-methionine (S)-S-oxide reductase